MLSTKVLLFLSTKTTRTLKQTKPAFLQLSTLRGGRKTKYDESSTLSRKAPSFDRKEKSIPFETLHKVTPVNELGFPDDELSLHEQALDEEILDDEEDFDDENHKDEEDEEDHSFPSFGKQLLRLGTSRYRQHADIPLWLQDRIKEIADLRTKAQIRRCFKSWMIKYDREINTKYIKKSLIWYDDSHKNPEKKLVYGPEETIAYAHFILPNKYTFNIRVLTEIQTLFKGFVPKRVLDFGCGPATSGAALASLWPNQIQSYFGIDSSQSMIDAAKIVLDELIPNTTLWNRNSDLIQRIIKHNQRFDLVIASYSLNELKNDVAKKAATQMLYEALDENGILVIIEQGNPYGSHTVRTAREFLLNLSNSVNERGVFTPFPDPLTTEKSDNSSKKQGGKGSKDNVRDKLAQLHQETMNSLNQTKDESINEQLFTKFQQKQMKHISVEDPFNSLKESLQKKDEKKNPSHREYMMFSPPNLEKKHSDYKAKVVSPCTHDKPCPLAVGEWCAFPQKVYNQITHRFVHESFSYVVIQKVLKDKPLSSGHLTWTDPISFQKPEFSSFVENPNHLLTQETVSTASPYQIISQYNRPMETNTSEYNHEKAVNQLLKVLDWESYDPYLIRSQWNRLIRSPLKKKGHVVLDMCTNEGKKQRFIHSRARLSNLPNFYVGVRRLTWGGLIPDYMNQSVKKQDKQSKQNKHRESKKKEIVQKQYQEDKNIESEEFYSSETISSKDLRQVPLNEIVERSTEPTKGSARKRARSIPSIRRF